MDVTHYDDDLNYLQSRLNGTIVKLKEDGSPFLIHDVYYEIDEDGDVIDDRVKVNGVKYAGTEFHKTLYLDDVDINPFPIGNINYGGHCSFVQRTASRQYKQGLWSHNYITNDYIPFTHKSIINAIRNEYPSVNESFELLVCGECSDIALTRDLSLASVYKDHDFFVSSLFYRCTILIAEVWFRPKDKFLKLEFGEHYKYMEEYVKEQLNVS